MPQVNTETSAKLCWREMIQAIYFDKLTIEETAAAFDVDPADVKEGVAAFRRHCVETFNATSVGKRNETATKQDKGTTFPFSQIRQAMASKRWSDEKTRVLTNALREYYVPGERIDVSGYSSKLACPAYYVSLALQRLMAEGLVERRPPCLYYFTEKGARND